MIEGLYGDIRYGRRMIFKKPALTVVAVLTLALGIGANTAIFSVVDAVLLRRLPFPDPDRLILVFNTAPQFGYPQAPIPYGTLVDIAEQNQVFKQMGAWELWDNNVNLSGHGEPEQVRRTLVSADLFSTLGVEPMYGRTFRQEEDRADTPPVAVISEGLWKRRFGGDPSLIGNQVILHTRSYTVIGIMPSTFTFPTYGTPPDVWLVLSQVESQWWNREDRGSHDFGVIGRLKEGVNSSQAQAEMNTLASMLEQEFPESNTGFGIQAVRIHDQKVRSIHLSLMILLGAVAFVLLIACTNVANILLARANSRRKEIALRLVMGASRWRVIRQLLIESVMLSLMGGGLGVLLALWGIGAFATVPSGKPDVYTPSAIAPEQIDIKGLPLSEDDNTRFIQIEGQPPAPAGQKNLSRFHYVSADYFRAIGIGLVEGRLFDEHDTFDARVAGIINETFARRFLPGENPIGKRVNPGDWLRPQCETLCAPSTRINLSIV